MVQFYSSDGHFLDLAGMPLSSPVQQQPDGTVYMRAQKAVLVLRQGGTDRSQQPVTLMDLSGVMIESGLLPREATIPVPRQGAPTVRVTDLTLPQRMRLQPQPWVVEVEVGNADPQTLMDQGFKATLQVAWPGTGASTLLENPKIVGKKLQFATSGFPDEVARKVRESGSRPAILQLALTPQLEGPLLGQKAWRTSLGAQTFERSVRDSTPLEHFSDFAPLSYGVGAIGVLIALCFLFVISKFKALPLLGGALRSIGSLMRTVTEAVQAGYRQSLKNRHFHGSLELAGRRIALKRYDPEGKLRHWNPFNVLQHVITLRSGSTEVQANIGVDRSGAMYIGAAGLGGEVKVNGQVRRGMARLSNGYSVQVGTVKMRLTDDQERDTTTRGSSPATNRGAARTRRSGTPRQPSSPSTRPAATKRSASRGNRWTGARP